MTFPRADGVKLSESDYAALTEIRRKLEAGRTLSAVLAIAPIAAVLSSNPVGATVTILTSDWLALAQAVRALPIVARAAARSEAEAALMPAIAANDRKRIQFWRAWIMALR